MSDDSFFREVDSELRSDRMQQFWDQFGKIIIAAAVLIVLVIAGGRAWDWYQTNRAQTMGDAYMQAVDLAEAGDGDAARTALAAIASDAPATYRALANMRRAAELTAAGEQTEAVALFDAVAGEGAVDDELRAIASIRAAMVLVDTGTLADVESRVQRLTAPGAPWRGSAREALGLASYKADDLAAAFTQFTTIADDADLPSGLRQRAGVMLDVIASRGGPVRATDEAVPAAAEPAEPVEATDG